MDAVGRLIPIDALSTRANFRLEQIGIATGQEDSIERELLWNGAGEPVSLMLNSLRKTSHSGPSDIPAIKLHADLLGANIALEIYIRYFADALVCNGRSGPCVRLWNLRWVDTVSHKGQNGRIGG